AAAGLRTADALHDRGRVHDAHDPRRRRRAAALRLSPGLVAARLHAVLPVGDGGRGTPARPARGSRAQVDSRHSVVRAIEDLGVVAVIRMKDAAKLRAVIDALADGGVRAIEVTMTVPGAIGMIGELARTLPSEILLGAGTVIDAA